MALKHLLVIILLILVKNLPLAELDPTSTETTINDAIGQLEPPVAHAATATTVVKPIAKRVIYINQCNVTDVNAARTTTSTTTTRRPFSELDPPYLHRDHEEDVDANKKEIEFYTNTTIYRLRIMNAPLTCASEAPPAMYQSKDESGGKNSGEDKQDDDYYYYDEDHELAALVHDDDDDDHSVQSNFLKLVQPIAPPRPPPPPPGPPQSLGTSPITAANTVPNPATNTTSNGAEQKNHNDLYILGDGRLQVDSTYYNIEDYCIASFQGPVVKVLACNQICSPPKFPCIRKCCEFGYTFDIGEGKCVKSNRTLEWSPQFYQPPPEAEVESESDQNHNTTTGGNKKPMFQIQMPSGCVHGFDIWPFEFGDNLQLRGLQEYTKLRLLPDGSVQYLTRSRRWHSLQFAMDDFCIESGELIPNLIQNQMIIKCSHASYSQEIGIITLLIAVLYSIGSVFLTIITTLFILLWDDMTNIHTWTVFIEIIILLLHYIILTTIYYLILNVNTTFWILGSNACVVLGVFSHFTYIAIFSWMAILNYDFYVTFYTKNTNGDPKTLTTSALRFLAYFGLGFGIPALVIGFGILMDRLYVDPESGIMVPAYGEYFACSMSRWAEGAYTFFPIGLLYIVSIVYMIRTHYLINETKSSRNHILWRSETEQENAQPDEQIRLGKYWWYRMLFNISIICGLTWIVQIISFIVFNIKSSAGDTTISAAGTSLIYVSISDLVLGIQPIGICIVFLIQDRVWKQLITKYGICRRFNTQLDKWTSGKAKALAQPVVIKRQRYNLVNAANAKNTEEGTEEEIMSMVAGCCKESEPTIESVIPTMDYLDGKQRQADQSPETSIESISYKCLPDPDRETNV